MTRSTGRRPSSRRTATSRRQRQIDAISLGEKLKAAGASNDQILDALRAHFALAGAAAEKKKAAAENDE